MATPHTRLDVAQAPELRGSVASSPIPKPTSPQETYGEFILRGARTRELERVRAELRRQFPAAARMALLVTSAFALALGLLWLKAPNVMAFDHRPILNTYSLLIAVYLLSRIGLAWDFERRERRKHAQTRSPQTGDLPRLSLVVVCRNEETAIYKTLENCYYTYYPQSKIEVIAVDDASTDNTYAEMQRAQQVFPSLTIVRLAQHGGKRRGMAEGVKLAKGDVIVFVDSDSFLDPRALEYLVRNFSDPDVAAVTGRTDVENAQVNVLTKMQAFRYFVAFKFMKAAESLYSTVTCCPGCFSAYRKSDLLPILDEWLNQRFLGKQATFGDDRSLTTMTLKRGRKVVYEDRAVCTTLVPENWPRYLRQQVRWKKSWLRETFLASAFMWKRHPIMAMSFYMGALFPLLTPLVCFYHLFYQVLWFGRAPTYYVLGLLIMAGLFSCAYAWKRADRFWIHGFAYTMLYAVALVWQLPYALLTLNRTHWGTRS